MADERVVRKRPSTSFDRSLIPQSLLGEASAAADWHHGLVDHDLFVRIDTYEKFKEEAILFVFGRRGTGKTALVKMLQHDARRDRVRPYVASWTIDQEEAFYGLAAQVRLTALASIKPVELQQWLAKAWSWMITTCGMQAVVYQAGRRPPGIDAHAEELSTLRKYLADYGLLHGADADGNDTNVLALLLRVVAEEVAGSNGSSAADGLRLLSRLEARLMTKGFEAARAALQRVATKLEGYILVLIDSLDQYNIDDDVSRTVLSSLMLTANRMYEERVSRRLLVKVAFPSELHGRIDMPNPTKLAPRCLFIIWTYSDLLEVIARRYRRLLLEGEVQSASRARPQRTPTVAFGDAREFLYRFMPEAVEIGVAQRLDTLSYIVRHTQKKPRQLIVIFNTVLTLAKEEGVDWTCLDEELVKRGVRTRLDILAEGSLEVVDYVYPNGSMFVKTALTGALSIFNARMLDKYVNRTRGLRCQPGAQMDAQEVKGLLIRAGVVGKVKRVWQSRANGAFMEAQFEYQVPHALTPAPDDLFAIHPMFYGYLETRCARPEFVYPEPSDPEEVVVLGRL